jgi:mitogen-activated protein kinase kinase
MSQLNFHKEKELPALPIHNQKLDTAHLEIPKRSGPIVNNLEVKNEDLTKSKKNFLSCENTFPNSSGLSNRRAVPPLTLNLQNNNNSTSNINSRSPFDSSLISPAQFSASSTEDAQFLFTNEENNVLLSDKARCLTLPIRNIKTLQNDIVIHQNSSTNIMSARFRTKESSDDINDNKSLNRRNFKKLTLDPIKIINRDTEQLNGTAEPSKMNIKDPEKKIDTDELIKNIRNLELGLEYQMPIRADELVRLKKLGSGQSGTVSKVLHLPTQKTMARKTVHLEAKEVIQSQIMRELRIMHECDSPFIIEFYGTFLQEGNVIICMEYADCGSLAHVFKITGPFPEFMLKHIAYSVLSGLIYLYDNHRIIHRDVKPSNVLLTSKGKIKLCDFGVSRELINSMADTFVGTSTYMSPERIQGGVYSVKGDVWSLGIMLYELASGNSAFANENSGQTSILELLQRIVNEQPPSLSVKDGFSPELSNFVSLCLKKENQRSGPWDLMNHPFLADFVDEDGIRVSSKYRGDIRKWAKNVRRGKRMNL